MSQPGGNDDPWESTVLMPQPEASGPGGTVITEPESETPPETEPEPEAEAGPDATIDDVQRAPIPPTVRDVPRRRWPFILAAVVIAALACVAVYLYFGVWRHEPTAHRHIPEGANIIVRADAGELLLFKPVREHIWPVVLERKKVDDKSRRLERIEQETGVSIPSDLP